MNNSNAPTFSAGIIVGQNLEVTTQCEGELDINMAESIASSLVRLAEAIREEARERTTFAAG